MIGYEGTRRVLVLQDCHTVYNLNPVRPYEIYDAVYEPTEDAWFLFALQDYIHNNNAKALKKGTMSTPRHVDDLYDQVAYEPHNHSWPATRNTTQSEMTQMQTMSDLTDIDATLAERGSRHGVFATHAKITQDIKRAMYQGNWAKLADDQRECLEMLAHKISRILNGDPDYHDSWHDIVGYAKLVADRLARQ